MAGNVYNDMQAKGLKVVHISPAIAGERTPVTQNMGYDDDRTLTDIADRDWVTKGMINSVIPDVVDPVVVPVTAPSSSFEYDSGVIGSIPPKMGIYLVIDGVYQEFSKPYWNGATGIITTDVDASADDYVLVVG